MKKFFSRRYLVLVFLFLHSTLNAAPAPVVSSTLDQGDAKEKGFGIGMTTSIAQRPFVGVDDQSASLLYLSYRKDAFYIEGLDVGYNFLKNKNFKLDVLATPRFYEVEPAFADNGELDGIDKTKPTYLGGISMQSTYSDVTYTFQVLHDLIESDGNELVLQASKSFKTANKLTLSPSVGIAYQDSKLVDYFYGVQSNEVTANRALYSGDSALNYNATLHAKWELTKHIEMIGQLRYEVLGDGITNSPIVNEDSLYFITLGLLYRF